MRKFLTVAVAAAMMLALCSGAYAGQIWTDGNGDGMPDVGLIPATPSTNVTFGVWMDAQGFTFTNYLAYVEWGAGCMSYVSAAYVITGGSNFPVDNFNHPRGVGFGGQGFNRGGVALVGNVTLHLDGLACCVTPIIDIYNPYYVFSQLGAGAAYQLFTTNPGTCYGEQPPATGACCFPDGSCAIRTASQCAAQGGAYAGDGVSCAQANCPPPPREACCFPDGSCVEANVGQCPAGSAPQGAGTDCSPNNCPQPQFQACCFPDGSCVNAPAGQCPAGSVPQPVGSSCATVTCPDTRPREACCFPDGSCADAIAGQCPAGSVPQGPGTSCATVVCPTTPRGACCFGSTCVPDVTRVDCEGNGGVYQGDGTGCTPNPCVGNAVESKSWGNIKGLYR